MKKIIRLTESDITRIVKLVINEMIDEHLDTVNNLDFAIQCAQQNWIDKNSYCLIEIIQRAKDNTNVLDDTGNSIFSITKERGKNIKHDNVIASATINGKTLEEFIQNLRNPILHIYGKFRDLLGYGDTITCNDNNIGNVIDICDKFNARAYLSPVKQGLSDKMKSEIKPNSMTPNRIKDLIGKTDIDSKRLKLDWITNHVDRNWPYGFIDCDIDDEGVVKQIIDILKKYSITKYGVRPSHNGYHIIFPTKQNGLMNLFQIRDIQKKTKSRILYIWNTVISQRSRR